VAFAGMGDCCTGAADDNCADGEMAAVACLSSRCSFAIIASPKGESRDPMYEILISYFPI
jgi:hypothetical protein